jgi:hypothetical protein
VSLLPHCLPSPLHSGALNKPSPTEKQQAQRSESLIKGISAAFAPEMPWELKPGHGPQGQRKKYGERKMRNNVKATSKVGAADVKIGDDGAMQDVPPTVDEHEEEISRSQSDSALQVRTQNTQQLGEDTPPVFTKLTCSRFVLPFVCVSVSLVRPAPLADNPTGRSSGSGGFCTSWSDRHIR